MSTLEVLHAWLGQVQPSTEKDVAERLRLASNVEANIASPEAWLQFLTFEERTLPPEIVTHQSVRGRGYCLYNVYTKATEELKNCPQKSSDAYIQLWIKYAKLEGRRDRKNGIKTFESLFNIRIGRQCAVLYLEWAQLHLDGKEGSAKALEVLQKGLKQQAQPSSVLEELMGKIQGSNDENKDANKPSAVPSSTHKHSTPQTSSNKQVTASGGAALRATSSLRAIDNFAALRQSRLGSTQEHAAYLMDGPGSHLATAAASKLPTQHASLGAWCTSSSNRPGDLSCASEHTAPNQNGEQRSRDALCIAEPNHVPDSTAKGMSSVPTVTLHTAARPTLYGEAAAPGSVLPTGGFGAATMTGGADHSLAWLQYPAANGTVHTRNLTGPIPYRGHDTTPITGTLDDHGQQHGQDGMSSAGPGLVPVSTTKGMQTGTLHTIVETPTAAPASGQGATAQLGATEPGAGWLQRRAGNSTTGPLMAFAYTGSHTGGLLDQSNQQHGANALHAPEPSLAVPDTRGGVASMSTATLHCMPSYDTTAPRNGMSTAGSTTATHTRSTGSSLVAPSGRKSTASMSTATLHSTAGVDSIASRSGLPAAGSGSVTRTGSAGLRGPPMRLLASEGQSTPFPSTSPVDEVAQDLAHKLLVTDGARKRRADAEYPSASMTLLEAVAESYKRLSPDRSFASEGAAYASSSVAAPVAPAPTHAGTVEASAERAALATPQHQRLPDGDVDMDLVTPLLAEAALPAYPSHSDSSASREAALATRPAPSQQQGTVSALQQHNAANPQQQQENQWVASGAKMPTRHPTQPPVALQELDPQASAAGHAPPYSSGLQQAGAAGEQRASMPERHAAGQAAMVVASLPKQDAQQRVRKPLSVLPIPPAVSQTFGDEQQMKTASAQIPAERHIAVGSQQAFQPSALPIPGDARELPPCCERDNYFCIRGVWYKRLQMIGKGGSCKVYKVEGPDNQHYALKRINLVGHSSAAVESFIREKDLLEKLRNKETIIHMYSWEIDEVARRLYMVLELGETDLARLIQKHEAALRGEKDGKLVSENVLRMWWEQMLKGVQDLHKEKIIHADLKPANFMLVKGQLKLIDFGIARTMVGDDTRVHFDIVMGTLSYMSPESILVNSSPSIKVSRASDVWSLGCILYQLVCGHTPFSGVHHGLRQAAICDDKVPVPFPENCYMPDAIDVLKQCLNRNPEKRMTTKELLEHPFLHREKAIQQQLQQAQQSMPAAPLLDEKAKEMLKKMLSQVAAAGPSAMDFDSLSENILKQLAGGAGCQSTLAAAMDEGCLLPFSQHGLASVQEEPSMPAATSTQQRLTGTHTGWASSAAQAQHAMPAPAALAAPSKVPTAPPPPPPPLPAPPSNQAVQGPQKPCPRPAPPPPPPPMAGLLQAKEPARPAAPARPAMQNVALGSIAEAAAAAAQRRQERQAAGDDKAGAVSKVAPVPAAPAHLSIAQQAAAVVAKRQAAQQQAALEAASDPACAQPLPHKGTKGAGATQPATGKAPALSSASAASTQGGSLEALVLQGLQRFTVDEDWTMTEAL